MSPIDWTVRLPPSHQTTTDASASASASTNPNPSPSLDGLHGTSGVEDPTIRILGQSAAKPPVVRHYSWSEEDRKHALQARLLDMEEAKKNGFTETLHGFE